MGLFDAFTQLDENQNQGLLAAAAQMLMQSGPSRTPTSLGQIAGGGLMAYQAGTEAAKRRKLEEQEAQQVADMRAMQLQSGRFNLERDQRAAAKDEEISALAPQFLRTPGQMAAALPGGPTNENAAQISSMQPGFDLDGYTNAVMQRDPLKGLALKQQFAKQAPQVDRVDIASDPATGRLVRVITFKDGSEKVSPFDPKAEMTEMNLGGTTRWVDKNKLADGQTFARTVSPDSVLSAQTTMRGQNMTDARARDLNAITRQGQQTQVFNDPERGLILVDKSTGQARTASGVDGQPFRSEAAVKRENASNKVLPLLTQAEKLISQATGSYTGAAIDQIGRAFGGATPGADAIAKLKVVEGQLMMSQPRMEGPQSNTDVLLYRQMAGQIGDPTVPASMKTAALSTIRELAEKYASPEAIAADKAPDKKNGWSIRKVD